MEETGGGSDDGVGKPPAARLHETDIRPTPRPIGREATFEASTRIHERCHGLPGHSRTLQGTLSDRRDVESTTAAVHQVRADVTLPLATSSRATTDAHRDHVKDAARSHVTDTRLPG